MNLAELARAEMQGAGGDRQRSITCLNAIKHVLAQAIVAYTQGHETASAEIAGILAADLIKDTAAGARHVQNRPGRTERQH